MKRGRFLALLAGGGALSYGAAKAGRKEQNQLVVPEIPLTEAAQAWIAAGFPVTRNGPRYVVGIMDAGTVEIIHRTWLTVDEALDGWLGQRGRAVPRALVWPREGEEVITRTCDHRAGDAKYPDRMGFFSRSCGLVHLRPCLKEQPRELWLRVVRHELYHQRMAAAGFGPCQGKGAWIVEGLATLFETRDAEGFQTVSDERFSQALALIRAEAFRTWREFLELDRLGLEAIRPMDTSYTHGAIMRRRGLPVAYVQSFALAAFLESSDPARFPAFALEARRLGGRAPVIQDLLGLSVEDIDSNLPRWVRGASAALWLADSSDASDSERRSK